MSDSNLSAKQTFVAAALIAGFIALFAFAPPRDPTKPVPGIPCSVLAENEISAALGTPMRLMPTSGTICQYVANGSGHTRALFVIAKHDPRPRAGDGTYTRSGQYAYVVHLVPDAGDSSNAPATEQRLAKLIHRPLVAQNH